MSISNQNQKPVQAILSNYAKPNPLFPEGMILIYSGNRHFSQAWDPAMTHAGNARMAIIKFAEKYPEFPMSDWEGAPSDEKGHSWAWLNLTAYTERLLELPEGCRIVFAGEEEAKPVPVLGFKNQDTAQACLCISNTGGIYSLVISAETREDLDPEYFLELALAVEPSIEFRLVDMSEFAEHLLGVWDSVNDPNYDKA